MPNQSGAPGCVIGLTNFSHYHSMHGFCRNFQHFAAFVYYLFCSFFHVILSLRSFFAISGC